MASTETTTEDVVRRLDIIIALLLEHASESSNVSMTDKIVKLAEMGLSQAEIGRVLGKGSNYVGAALAQRRKVKRGG